MGKAGRWFRALLGSKKKSESSSTNTGSDSRPVKKGGVAKFSNGSGRSNSGGGACGATRVSGNEDPSASPYVDALDANKHAIAVAAATAAVAEAAMAAAQAAAAVVRLTSGNRTAAAYVNSSIERRREWAAVKIQSEFRAYLARRALRALKGLVKLQALVRGRIVRKQSANMLRRMQTMARIQARASANRTLVSDPSGSSTKPSRFDNPGIATPRKYDPRQHSFSAKHNGTSNLKKFGSKLNAEESNNQDRTHLASHWLHRWMEECARNSYGDISQTKGCGDHDESTDKILEIDTWKPRLNPKSSEKPTHNSQFSSRKDNAQGMRTVKSLSRHLASHKKPNPSVSSGEVSSLRSPAFDQETDQPAVWPLDHSPSVRSTLSRPGCSSRGGPFTPPKSECSRSLFGDYLGHPNYMANTESYLAKVRSQSAPRQRMQFETIGSRTYVDGLLDAETNSEKSWSLHANFRNKAKAGSGRSDRVRTPDHRNAVRSSSPFGLSQ